MSLIEKFHAIGNGRELKDFLIKQLGLPLDKSGVDAKVVNQYLEQLFIIDHNEIIELPKIMKAIKAYYRTKSHDLNFYQETFGTFDGEIIFAKPKADNHDSLTISNYQHLLITLSTVPFSYVGPSEPLQ